MTAPALLTLEDLAVTFATARGPLRAVDGVSLTVAPGETLGLVGESGSGKSVTLRAVLRLLRGDARVGGRVLWRGRDVLAMDDQELASIRGREIAMVFQEPMSALDPVLPIGLQITETVAAHRTMSRPARRKRAIELLDQVGIPSAARRLDQYPHEFSGGMRQRAMIAIALAAEPRLLLADEPTTALDVTIQDQILCLLAGLVDDLGMAMILVTHDLGVVAETCDRVCVMYAGRVVESGPIADVFARPKHAYAAALLDSIPAGVAPRAPLRAIAGQPPRLAGAIDCCAFAPRCGYAMEACLAARPAFVERAPGHGSACLAADRIPARSAAA